jgi:hypothetical protein
MALEAAVGMAHAVRLRRLLGAVCAVVAGCGSVGLAATVELSLADRSRFIETEEPLEGGPKITRAATAVVATLANGCRVSLDTATNAVQVAHADGVTILATEPGPVAGLRWLPPGLGPDVQPVKDTSGHRFRQLASYGEAVIFRFRSEADPPTEIEWAFRPVRRRIGGHIFDGVADSVTILDATRMLHEVALSGLVATGADFAGARTIRLACFGEQAGHADVTFGGKRHDLGWWGAFIDGGQLFHVVGQRQGTVVEYLDDECHDMTNIRTNGRNDAVEIRHVLLAGRVPGIWQSPRRHRLFTAEPLTPQVWVDVAASRRAALAVKYDIPPTRHRPMLVARNFWQRGSFEAFAATDLSRLAELGWRRLEIGWVYRRGLAPATGHAWPSSAVYNDAGTPVAYPALQTEEKDRLLETHGGPAAIKGLVEAAHTRDVEVYVWHQTAHGWRGSDDVRNHPDWIVHGPTGKPVGGGHAESLVFFDLRSGFRQATLERIRRIKAETGVDGFWLDLYGAGLHRTANYIHTVTAPTAAERMEYLRDLRMMGLGLYAEGVSGTLIDSFILWKEPNWRGHEFILQGTSPFMMGRSAFADTDAFVLASYRCFPTDIPAALEPAGNDDDRRWIESLVHRNRCVNAIEDELGDPVGLVLHPFGTEWAHERGTALFFHTPTDIVVPVSRPPRAVRGIGPGGDVTATVKPSRVAARMPAQSVLLIAAE